MEVKGEVFLGVDIGGTKVAAGLVNDRGDILYKTRNPMNATQGAQEAVAAVCEAIDRTMSENPGASVRAIGLSAPGSVDPRTGSVVMATNVPCWKNFALAPLIADRYKLPSELHNDANAAGLAEGIWAADPNTTASSMRRSEPESEPRFSLTVTFTWEEREPPAKAGT